MIERPYYMNALNKYKNVPIVKILAGVRRSGKSTLLDMWQKKLLQEGIKPERIIKISYVTDDMPSDFDHRAMYNDLLSKIKGRGKHYLLLDEVQEIDQWEKAVNSILETRNADIYLTGSNSRLMSSEISTYLTGRYVNIFVYPLSFAEYTLFKKKSKLSKRELFFQYLRFGGFPLTALKNYEEQEIYHLVQGIYQSVVEGDIVRRHRIMNVEMFSRVALFVLENVGKTFSANSITQFLKSQGRKLSVEAVYNYLEWLEKAFILYRCKRYNLQGKEILKTQEKFYVSDSAIKYCQTGYSSESVSAMLENIVYFELRRRGYDVYIGKSGTKEIDFVAKNNEGLLYVQVCRNLPESSEREFENLRTIKDNYPKIILTLDEAAGGNLDGIKIVNLVEWLNGNE